MYEVRHGMGHRTICMVMCKAEISLYAISDGICTSSWAESTGHTIIVDRGR